MPEFLTALIALVLAVVVSLFLRGPIEKLVLFLKKRTPRQMNFLIAIAFVAVVIELFIFRKP